MKTLRSGLMAALLGTSGLTFAAPAVAQQETSPRAAPPEAATQDIIVTARRREELLQDVPISITVFNEQQLANRNVTNASDLALFTPSLSANTNFGSQNSSFAIRGFVQDIGTPPSVGVYFADVVTPRGPTQGTTGGDGAGPGMMFDLQNVQVLKGPQGTLQGRNTTGGSVLIVPQKPTEILEGYVEASAGNRGMWRIQGVVNIPLADTMRLRLAVDHQSRDGYLRSDTGTGPRDFNDTDYTAVRASLVGELTSDLENYFIATYSRSETHGDLQKLIACNSALSAANFLGLLSCGQLAAEKAGGTGFYTAQNSTFDNPVSRLRQWQVINTTTWRASDAVTIKNIVSYAELTNFLRSSLFGTNWYLAPSVPLPFTGVNPAPGMDSASQSTFTEELQVQGLSTDERLQYQGGVYLEISDPLGRSGNRNPTFISCSNLNALECTSLLGPTSNVNEKIGKTAYRSTGIYAQGTYELTQALKLTAGLRYTWDRQTASVSNKEYFFPAPNVPEVSCTYPSSEPTCEIAPPKAKSSAPTWLVDLEYKPAETVMLYAKYSRGYRAGGVFPNSPSNYRIFDPEKVDAYEIGAKTSFDGPVRGTFNVAAFYNNFTNQQLSVGFVGVDGTAPTTGVVNAGRSRIYGVELEALLKPFEGFTIDGAYTYLHARIVSIAPLVSTDPNYAISQEISAGDRLALSPEHKFSVTAAYTLPLDPGVGAVTISGTYSYRSSQYSTYAYETPAVYEAFGANLGKLPSLGLLNLNLNWNSVASLPVDLSLFATNVTREHYYTYVPGLASYGFETASVGEPRMYGARLKYHFR
ncbi:iron complex outermembrane receptor protein [Novosphingobium sp. PhB55]|uniref:TonB-dependent receptor n=1 Tax=Novosphingobium sp. PhB55 TaxID=2485106 RepID=UPI001065885B|nr:TonB-dependent receptor [Novosphingobium sp. PhB55]TDW59949.1 iron complex outermembrane receptor protein [Novosphingobium sp. PhB55]